MKIAKLFVLALSLCGFVAHAQLDDGGETNSKPGMGQEEPARAPAKDKKKKKSKKKKSKKKASHQ